MRACFCSKWAADYASPRDLPIFWAYSRCTLAAPTSMGHVASSRTAPEFLFEGWRNSSVSWLSRWSVFRRFRFVRRDPVSLLLLLLPSRLLFVRRSAAASFVATRHHGSRFPTLLRTIPNNVYAKITGHAFGYYTDILEVETRVGFVYFIEAGFSRLACVELE